MKPTDDAKLNILNDHYKDTFVWLQETRKQRDQLYVLVVAAAALLVFQLVSPKDAGLAIGQIVSKQLGLQAPIDVSILGSLIWFALLGLSIRYFQTTISLERQYKYIHSLEEELCIVFDEKVFIREGKFYLTQFSEFSNLTWLLYSWASPALLVIVALAKIINEWTPTPTLTFTLLFNTIVAILILGLTVMYIRTVHFKPKGVPGAQNE